MSQEREKHTTSDGTTYYRYKVKHEDMPESVRRRTRWTELRSHMKQLEVGESVVLTIEEKDVTEKGLEHAMSLARNSAYQTAGRIGIKVSTTVDGNKLWVSRVR